MLRGYLLKGVGVGAAIALADRAGRHPLRPPGAPGRPAGRSDFGPGSIAVRAAFSCFVAPACRSRWRAAISADASPARSPKIRQGYRRGAMFHIPAAPRWAQRVYCRLGLVLSKSRTEANAGSFGRRAGPPPSSPRSAASFCRSRRRGLFVACPEMPCLRLPMPPRPCCIAATFGRAFGQTLSSLATPGVPIIASTSRRLVGSSRKTPSMRLVTMVTPGL
jgi:hypothetical protein